MTHDPTQQPQPQAPPPPPQGAPPPPPPQGGYAPAPYGGAPAYGVAMPPALQGRELSGWGIRFGAALLDGLFILVTLLIGWVVNFFLMGREGERNGQTLGKQVCNIRVIKEDGTPMTTGYAVLRDFVIKGLLFGTVGGFFFGIPTLVNYLWPLWDDKNQALHDKVASTYVVNG